jgi:hypothetical protein
MKSHTKKAVVRQELALIYDELYAKFAADLTKSVVAAVLVTLATDYGLKKEQLLDVQRSIEQHFVLMEQPFPGKPYTTAVDREWLKNEFGIDLDQSQLWRPAKSCYFRR